MEKALADKIINFFGNYKSQVYKKGEILVRAGDDPGGVFYLTGGTVKQYAISKKGEELVVNIFKPGAFFPMSWAMNATPNAYFFEAMTECAVHIVPKEKVIDFLKKNPDVLYDLLSRVYKGTDGLLLRMTYLMSGSAYSRLVTELLLQIKRFGKEEDGQMILQISEQELAAMSGMTRESVSRNISILKEKGIILFEKRKITILRLDGLEDALVD